MISFFKRKDSEQPDTGTDSDGGLARDPRKAARFFKHAQTVADARNYDYAIECYINGLKFEPEALDKHESLREVALKRKVNGGKPAGFMESMKHSGGKGLEKMLNFEYQWSKDPFNPSLALSFMEAAHEEELEEITYWAGQHVIDANKSSKRPSKHTYLKVRDIFAELGAYNKAVEACQYALMLDPQNASLVAEMKGLQAEQTMQKGKYQDGGSFRDSIQDADKQRSLEQEEQIAGSQSIVDANIENARANLAANPEDPDALVKLANALTRKEQNEPENEAMTLLSKVHKMTDQYRYKVRIGDIRIKQFNREIRRLRNELKDEPHNPRVKGMLKDLLQDKVEFELAEFTERAKEYPTDMGIRYQLGLRHFAKQEWDNAIECFQTAQNDPKHRAQALRYLGASFARKGWHNDAIDIYHRAIEAHPYKDDRIALELQYELVNSLESKAREDKNVEAVEEASKIASSIAQRDFNFKDIRERVEKLRDLRAELKADAAD